MTSPANTAGKVANLPKSLHTVTVLVAIARAEMNALPDDPELCIRYALAILGYADTPDAYGLAAKARALLAVRS